LQPDQLEPCAEILAAAIEEIIAACNSYIIWLISALIQI
jgi:hypothetical protein